MDKYGSKETSNRVVCDPLIVSRVHTYLTANVDKVYVDVEEVADYLQRRYREYRKRKQSPFRIMVRRAYDEISKNYERKSAAFMRQDEDNDDDDDDEVYDIQGDSQRLDMRSNNSIVRMYKKNTSNGNSCDKEVVDISSDDNVSDSDITAPKKTVEVPVTPNVSTVKPVKEITTLLSPSPAAVEKQTKKRPRDKDGENTQGLPTKKKSGFPVIEGNVNFQDIGGCTKVLETVCKLLVHIKHPEIFKQLGISPPRGFLLHGPPGCGKTLLAHAIAGELGIPLLKVAAPQLVAGVSGESESRIRELFDQAISIAPCILFLDEVDALAPHRANAQREMERRIVAQLLSCMDDMSFKQNGDRVLVVGATNRPDSLDPALRRAGRFDREVCLGIPDRKARLDILKLHTKSLTLASDVNLTRIAELTPGYVGADLVSLIREAAMIAVDRVFNQLEKKNTEPCNLTEEKVSEVEDHDSVIVPESKVESSPVSPKPSTSGQSQITFDEDLKPEQDEVLFKERNESPVTCSKLSNLRIWLRDEEPISPENLVNLSIEQIDFGDAIRVVQPSAKREGFATVPDVTWDDVGSLQDIHEELQMAILAPVRHSEHFAALGLTTPTGVLLCGPPGCGKTLLAKAIANEAGINFISVKGPELLNMYVGESEKAVRQCFVRARNSAPCVIFFDELDALCPKRSEGDNNASSRVVNQMLTEMDGIEGRKGVFLMAATNRPDIVDPAVLRPGRFDKTLYVGLPTASDRADVLRALTKNGTKPKLADDVDLNEIGNSTRCNGYTGADLSALVREAGIEALRETMTGPPGLAKICLRHIVAAFDKVRPSVSEEDIEKYENLRKTYSVTTKSSDVIPMETPIAAPLVDAIMEAMEA
ncbi:nuclear valosin-containing protein-like [Cephus cinctus]|uniref:Nuclear valosin-containing protein-like n=1 Tax=Cephus cinctus TaxID=211228 RepID=A0AAJ7RUS0_CEPCN|nr:nuclear valosin-containing protein-like [Cephus cinctus]